MTSALSHEAYPPHLLAQKLNNRAAFCIETGRYDRAISNLVKALKVSEQVDNVSTCTCKHCSLDGCMSFSQKVTGFERRHSRSTRTRSGSSTPSEVVEVDDGYIHRQPIHVTPHAMQEGHSMGLTLPLIITFNLALAHHLSAIEGCTPHTKLMVDRKKLKKVLQLYELAYRWQMEEEDEQFDCIRFTMIISNNLGEIHRAVNNRSKHVKCLQHLLSTMMFLVDCQHISSMQTDDDSLELDGFLRNTSQLILLGECAAAA
jgi:hypothetical protein